MVKERSYQYWVEQAHLALDRLLSLSQTLESSLEAGPGFAFFRDNQDDHYQNEARSAIRRWLSLGPHIQSPNEPARPQYTLGAVGVDPQALVAARALNKAKDLWFSIRTEAAKKADDDRRRARGRQ